MLPLLLALAVISSWSPEGVIRDYLLDSYPWPEIEVHDVVSGATLPAEKPLEVITERGPLGRASFILRFAGGGEIRVRARVTAKEQVLRTRRPLRKGTVLSPADLYTTMVDVKRIPRGAIKDGDAVAGMVLKRSLPADSTLTEMVVGEKPLIRKGQRVILQYRSGSLRVTSPGIAREDGYPEREIAVLSVTSRKTVKGIVENKEVVNVLP